MTPGSPFRLPDVAFWTIVAASALFCFAHAASIAVRASRLHVDAPGVRHSPFQRAFHWAHATAVGVLVVSGLAIYRAPALPAAGRPAAFWFAWHLWVTPFFAALVVAHVIRETRAGGDAEAMWQSPPRDGKYDRAQVAFHWAVAANLLALVVTGALLWAPVRALLPLRLLRLGWNVVFFGRVLHGLFTATLLALVLAHVYFALLVPEHRARTRSMLAGRAPGS